MQRDVDLLGDEITSDRFFNFVVTAYHLREWIKLDPTVPELAKHPAVMKAVSRNKWFRVCRDLANASKHFQLDSKRNPDPIVASATASKEEGDDPYGNGPYGAGDERIVIELTDGSRYHCLDLIAGVLNLWDRFFTTHSIGDQPAPSSR